MTTQLRSWARALGGDVSRRGVLCPGPGHSARDRSLSVTPSAAAPDGFLVHSFAGDDPIACKDFVRIKLGQPEFKPNGHKAGPPGRRRPSPRVWTSQSANGLQWTRRSHLMIGKT
jgi:hypothetical protein